MINLLMMITVHRLHCDKSFCLKPVNIGIGLRGKPRMKFDQLARNFMTFLPDSAFAQSVPKNSQAGEIGRGF